MKYAILADIHSHLAALEAVLRDAKAQGCHAMACLGDIVGYYDQPKECLDLIRALGMPCVQGNHDLYCSVDETLAGFNPKAAETVRWTRAQLTPEDCRWLLSLKHVEVVAGFTIVHGTLDHPELWEYLFDKMAAARTFALQTSPVCFFGHTHVPVAFVRDSTDRE